MVWSSPWCVFQHTFFFTLVCSSPCWVLHHGVFIKHSWSTICFHMNSFPVKKWINTESTRLQEWIKCAACFRLPGWAVTRLSCNISHLPICFRQIYLSIKSAPAPSFHVLCSPCSSCFPCYPCSPSSPLSPCSSCSLYSPCSPCSPSSSCSSCPLCSPCFPCSPSLHMHLVKVCLPFFHWLNKLLLTNKKKKRMFFTLTFVVVLNLHVFCTLSSPCSPCSGDFHAFASPTCLNKFLNK